MGLWFSRLVNINQRHIVRGGDLRASTELRVVSPLKELTAVNQREHFQIVWCGQFLKVQRFGTMEGEGRWGVLVIQESSRHGGDLIRLVDQTNMASVVHY